MFRKLKYEGTNRNDKTYWAILVLLVCLLTGCGAGGQSGESGNGATAAGGTGDEGAAQGAAPIHIVTTIAQIGEPLSVIGGERVIVESLMGPGVDPHLYNATQGDIQKLDRSNAVFYSGLHLEGNMTEIFEQIGRTRTVMGIAEVIEPDRLLRDEDGAIDPHVWFDIELWKEALSGATEALKQLSPEDADYFEDNKVLYFASLDDLYEDAASKLAQIPVEQRVLVTAHDAFGYFGRMFDIEVVGLQGLSTADEIGLSDIDGTIDILISHSVPAVFVETSVNQSAITAVIEGAASKGLEVRLGGELFSDAMGAEGTPEGTYIGMYEHNVNTIFKALTEGEDHHE